VRASSFEGMISWSGTQYYCTNEISPL